MKSFRVVPQSGYNAQSHTSCWQFELSRRQTESIKCLQYVQLEITPGPISNDRRNLGSARYRQVCRLSNSPTSSIQQSVPRSLHQRRRCPGTDRLEPVQQLRKPAVLPDSEDTRYDNKPKSRGNYHSTEVAKPAVVQYTSEFIRPTALKVTKLKYVDFGEKSRASEKHPLETIRLESVWSQSLMAKK